MADLSNTDKQKIEALLEMGGGYVLDFNNRTFEDFFATLGIKIYQDRFARGSGSKANYMRGFWDEESNSVVGKVIQELLERWRTNKLLGSSDISSKEQMLYDECSKIASRLLGNSQPETEKEFISKDIGKIDLSKLNIDESLRAAIDQRVSEIDKCIKAKAPLAAIFLCGSTLEGLLLDCASKNVSQFNTAASAAKDKKTNRVLPLHQWSLSQLIDSAKEKDFIKEDVKKFSHSLRDFRNYIHPHAQAVSGFNPSDQTAELCFKVLQMAMLQLSETT